MHVKRAWPQTFRELGLLVRVLGLLTALRLLLPRVQLPRLLRWLTPSRIPPVADSLTLEKAVHYTDALLWRLPFPLPGPCLPRSFILYYFATRCGFPARVHCGVRRLGEVLQGHAWLSLQGTPFLETDTLHGNYAVTFSFPSPQAGVMEQKVSPPPVSQ